MLFTTTFSSIFMAEQGTTSTNTDTNKTSIAAKQAEITKLEIEKTQLEKDLVSFDKQNKTDEHTKLDETLANLETLNFVINNEANYKEDNLTNLLANKKLLKIKLILLKKH